MGIGGTAHGVLSFGSIHCCRLPDRGTGTVRRVLDHADRTTEFEKDGWEDNSSAAMDIDCSVMGDIGDNGGDLVDAPLPVVGNPFDMAMVDTKNDGYHTMDPNGSYSERVNAGDCVLNLPRVYWMTLADQTCSSNVVE